MTERTQSDLTSEIDDIVQGEETAEDATADAGNGKAGKSAQTAWYLDPPKVVGVLGFILALGTLGERMWVRDQEQTFQRLQQLREVTSGLADIQVEYLEALTAAPSNIYALGVAKNTKRQMHLQTAAALLTYPAVRREASSTIFSTLGGEFMVDGRYQEAKDYFTDALNATGAHDATRPFLLRALGQLYRVPKTPFANPDTARNYFKQARDLFAERLDDTGHLSWAETVLSEASLEVTYGELERAKTLAHQAREQLKKVRAVSPLRTQLERIAEGLARGEQYAQIQDGPLQPVASRDTTVQRASNGSVPDRSAITTSIQIWEPISNQISGAEMDVNVDGEVVGHLSNLGSTRLLELPPLQAGVHKFHLSDMKAYFIDPAKGPSMTGGGFRCGGLFEVFTSSAVLKINVGSGPNGVMCALHDPHMSDVRHLKE